MLPFRLRPDLTLRMGGGSAAPAPAAPVMEVTGNSVPISNGDATPDAADHTDFGNTPYSITVLRTFTVTVTGAVTGINVLVPSGYTLVTPPDAAITDGSDTFVVRCDAGSVAVLAGNITVESTELDDYVFAVTCNSQHPYDAYGSSTALVFDAVKSSAFQSDGGAVAGQGDPVGKWSDGSGNSRHVLQVTSTAKPTLTTVDGVVCLSFDGGDFLEATVFSLNQPNIVLTVFKSTSTASQGVVSGQQGAATINEFSLLSTGAYRLFSGANLDGGAKDTNWHVAVATFDNTSSGLGVDGSAISSGSAGSQALAGISIGKRAAASQFLAGQCVAVYVFDTAPAAAVLTAIRAYYANEVLP